MVLRHPWSADFWLVIAGHLCLIHELIYAGHVGTGFNYLQRYVEIITKYKTNVMPFTQSPGVSKASWVKPAIIEVEFQNGRVDGVLRHQF